MESYSKEVCLLDDPVVTREGWDYTMDTEELLCVMCLHDEKMRMGIDILSKVRVSFDEAMKNLQKNLLKEEVER